MTAQRKDELLHAAWFLRYRADAFEARGLDVSRMRARATELEASVAEGKDPVR